MKKNKFYIYKITNTLNNMCYVGSTVEGPSCRWKRHINCSFNPNCHHYNYPLMKAFREFGVDKFSFEVISECNSYEEMIEQEQFYICKFNSLIPLGYNQTKQTDSPMHDQDIVNKVKETNRKKFGTSIGEINDEGVVLRKWNSMAECSEDTGISKNMLSSCCHGRCNTTNGRIFALLDEDDKPIERKATERSLSVGKKISKSLLLSHGRPVFEINSKGEVLGEWNSIKECSIDLGIDRRRISDVCLGKKRSYHGRFFKYDDEKRKEIDQSLTFKISQSSFSINTENINNLYSTSVSSYARQGLPSREAFLIYKVINVSNNMIYIGSTSNTAIHLHWEKLAYYNKNSCNFSRTLMNALNGNEEYFYFYPIETCFDKSTKLDRLSYWIKKYNSLYPNGYNLTDNPRSPCSTQRVCNKMKEMKRKTRGVKICEVDSNGAIIDRWNSIVECAESTGLKQWNISRVLGGIMQTTNGRIFRYLNDEGFPEISESKQTGKRYRLKNCIKVKAINVDTNEVQCYDSLVLAMVATGVSTSSIVTSCKKGWQYKQFIFQYI